MGDFLGGGNGPARIVKGLAQLPGERACLAVALIGARELHPAEPENLAQVNGELVLAGGDVRMWKPEPYIFIHACERLNIAPTEAVYVGDNYFADVVGARRAGLLPVLYDPRGIFPDPGCPIIRSFPELTQLLKANGTVTTARRR